MSGNWCFWFIKLLRWSAIWNGLRIKLDQMWSIFKCFLRERLWIALTVTMPIGPMDCVVHRKLLVDIISFLSITMASNLPKHDNRLLTHDSTILVSWKFSRKIGLRYLSSEPSLQQWNSHAKEVVCWIIVNCGRNKRFDVLPVLRALWSSEKIVFCSVYQNDWHGLVPIVVTAWMNLATIIIEVSFLTIIVQGQALVDYGTFLGLAWALLRIVIVSCLLRACVSLLWRWRAISALYHLVKKDMTVRWNSLWYCISAGAVSNVWRYLRHPMLAAIG